MTTAGSFPGANAPRQAWILRPEAPSSLRIWGLTPDERLRRSLARAGCRHVRVVISANGDEAPAGTSLLLFRGDVVLDERLVSGLMDVRGVVLMPPPRSGLEGAVAAHVDAADVPRALELLAGRTAAPVDEPGLRPVAPDELAPAYLAALRKSEPPLVLSGRADRARETEDRLFSAAYKGKTDLVTQWLWPRPAARVTRWLAAAGVHPNTVTLAGGILAIAAALLFWKGWFGIGLVAAWLMTFLDTVDGKLARVSLTSSRVGHVMDHGLDLVHPPFWYLAFGLGLGAGHAVATAVAVIGYLVGRLLEGVFLLAFRIETHAWRPLDSLFRTITARRNPNLILLSVGALGGRPDLGLVMVALWTLASLGFHSVRLAQAALESRRGTEIRRWDEAPAQAVRPSVLMETEDRSAA